MCPIINKAYSRCAEHMTLRNLSRAFAHCADHYTTCPIYRSLIAKKLHHDQTVTPAARFLAAS